MAGNPQIQQGLLNRVIASVIWDKFPGLNVSASYLAKEGIRFSFEGDSVTFHEVMAGTVPSPEPYQMVTVRANLLKTNGLAQAYKAQQAQYSVLGNGKVFPDTRALSPFRVYNCGIQTAGELSFAGDEPGYGFMLRGYILVNALLWG
jgi:hypothetical protein